MKISPYLNLNRIEFMVTYQCSGHCKHCSVGDVLNPPGDVKHISAQHASRAVKELSKIFPITSVMAFGGEPLLYPRPTYKILSTATRCGIDSRELITNGFFTNEESRRINVPKELKAAGLNNLLISVDAFHQKTIPIKAVYATAKYAKEAGIANIYLHPAWVVNEQHDNFYNAETKKILSEFADLKIPVSSGNNIFPAGNAAKFLAEFYDKPRLDLTEKCGSRPYTEPLTSITSVSIVPNGDVMVCGGFAIGNIHEQSISEIVSDYDPHENEIMNAVLTDGAAGLVEYAEKNRLDINTSRCYSVCDLCKLIRA